MVAGRTAAGKFPLTGQLSVTWRQRPDRLHLGGGRSGVDNHRGEPASLLLKLLNRGPLLRVGDEVHRPGQKWKKRLSI